MRPAFLVFIVKAMGEHAGFMNFLIASKMTFDDIQNNFCPSCSITLRSEQPKSA